MQRNHEENTTNGHRPSPDHDSSRIVEKKSTNFGHVGNTSTPSAPPTCSDRRLALDKSAETQPRNPSAAAQSNAENGDHTEGEVLFASFDDMGLCEGLLRGIYALGFEWPSHVQQRAVVPCCSGRDVIVQAQSGTGKTATFSIAILQQLNLSLSQCQAMVLSPTRELSRQTHTVLLTLGDYLDVSTCLVVSGERVADMAHRLRRGVQVVVGTPGRMKHMMEMGALDTRLVKILVLDEVDIMLSRGFEEQVRDIVTKLPGRNLQAISVSATLPPEVIQVTDKFMSSPMQILLKEDEIALDGILQFHVSVEREDHKFSTLCDIYEMISISQSIIFCNSRRKVDHLAEYMRAQDHTVSTIHSDHTPEERKRIMKEFKAGESRVLIGTDLIARGIDAQHVSVVCNVDLPRDMENYIHRIGRCGRFGRKGMAISLVTDNELRGIRALESHFKTKIPPLPHNVADLL